MTDPDPGPFDFEFRPESYWETPARLLANVKGEARRRAIRKAAEEGRLDELPPGFFADSVPAEQWRAAGQVVPSWMGGETLDDYAQGEVEIARVSYPKSVLGDVTVVRARRSGGRIRYRILDDNDNVYRARPATSRRPLTFGQLLSLLAGATPLDDEEDEGPGLVAHWYEKWAWDCSEYGMSPEESTAQIELSSPYYPELGAWYEHRAGAWREAWRADLAEEARRTGCVEDEYQQMLWDYDVPEHLGPLAVAAARRAREHGYHGPLFTLEAARAYVREGHVERAAAAYSALCGQPLPPERHAHLGPLDPRSFDLDAAPPGYFGPAFPRDGAPVAVDEAQQEDLLRELPGLVHAIAEACTADCRHGKLELRTVEIARVRVGDDPFEFLSLRARPDGGGIAYRLQDSERREFGLPRERSEGPLTLAELVQLLDGAWDRGPKGTDTPETSARRIGAVHVHWAEELERTGSADAARAFVTVSSVFYPMLNRWYEIEAERWFAARREADEAQGATLGHDD